MTRGRCGSLYHIRMTFAFTTPRRFNRRTRSDKMQTERAELYFRQGSSDKVYHLQLENVDDRWSVQAQWGRRGSALQRGIKANGVLTKKRSVCTTASYDRKRARAIESLKQLLMATRQFPLGCLPPKNILATSRNC